MDPEELKHRKTIISLSLGVIGLILLIIGATYAYFKAQQDAETENPINIQSGAVDVLTFDVQDLTVTGDNLADEDAGKDLIFSANEDNFARQGNSLADGVTATINLKAKAGRKQKYNIYLAIDSNDLIYTQDRNTPELLMYVEQPGGTELKEINGLQYYEDAHGFSGFDITNKNNVVFEIATDREITVTDEELKLATETWQVKLFLVNLEENQILNSAAQVHGEVIVTTVPADNILTLTHINSLNNVTKTADTLTTGLNYEEGTNKISKYYFGIAEIGASGNEIGSLRWDEGEETENHTFTDLKEGTNYKIYAYALDEAGFKSNIYQTEITFDNDNLLEITAAELTNVSYNSITVQVGGLTDEVNSLASYKYTLKTNAGEVASVTLPKEQSSYTFEGLYELTQYEIIINAIDNNGGTSPSYVLKTITLKNV